MWFGCAMFDVLKDQSLENCNYVEIESYTAWFRISGDDSFKSDSSCDEVFDSIVLDSYTGNLDGAIADYKLARNDIIGDFSDMSLNILTICATNTALPSGIVTVKWDSMCDQYHNTSDDIFIDIITAKAYEHGVVVETYVEAFTNVSLNRAIDELVESEVGYLPILPIFFALPGGEAALCYL